MDSKANNKKLEIKISKQEKEILREIVQSERASLKVFSLSNEKENKKYEKILNTLNSKLA